MKTDRAVPFLSIVTVTKDNLAGLHATRRSLEAQSSRDFEWIVIDGGSRDGSLEFLKERLPSRLVSEPDAGIYDAMNKGIALADGEYVLFLNAGDALSDADIIETLRKAASGRPDFIYGDALESNGFYKKARSHERLAGGMFTHHQAMLYRRARIGELRYDQRYRIAADFAFTAVFLRESPNAHYIPCAICVFEDGGVSQRNRTLGRNEQFRIKRELRISGLVRSCAVYAAQTLSAALRVFAPAAYFALRKKLQK